MSLLSLILIFSFIAGQLIKIPGGTQGGLILLDLAVLTLDLVGLVVLKFHLKKPPLFIKAAILFTGICLLSLLLTPLNLDTFELINSLFYTIRFSAYVLLAWLIYSKAFNVTFQQIKEILIVSGVGLAILGLLQFIFLPDLSFLSGGWDTHYFRTVSTFLDPNFIGAFFVLTLLLITKKIWERSLNKQRLYVLMFAVSYLALLTTYSRSSYGMFLVSFVTLAIFKKTLKFLLISISLFLILLLGFYFYSLAIATPRGINREQSAKFRLGSWERGVYIFSQSPVLGVGFNSYRYALKEYNLAPEALIAGRGGTGNDSSLLHVAATTGIVGLLSFIILLLTLIFQRWQKPISKNLPKGIMASAVPGLIAHSFFANSLFYPPILLWLLLVAAKENLNYDKD